MPVDGVTQQVTPSFFDLAFDDGHTVVHELLNLASYNYLGISYRDEVKEAAIETVVPITTEDFVLGKLDINAAARATSYSLAGDVKTWKLGATYVPFEDLTVRVTRSHDIRAPNHTEAFTTAAVNQGINACP